MTKDLLGNPVDRRHPWNQHTIPQPQKRDFDGKLQLGHGSSVVRWSRSPRSGHRRRPLGPSVAIALSGLVDIGYIKATGHSIEFHLPRTALKPEQDFVWDVPKWSNCIERHRARSYFQLYACCCALHFMDKALAEIRAGHTKTWSPFTVPDEAIGCGFIEAVRGASLSTTFVISAVGRCRPTTTRTRRPLGTPTRVEATAPLDPTKIRS